MYQKFIINQNGTLKFGHVYLHKDLLGFGEKCCYGGGLWLIDEKRRAVLLYGRSFDFGPPNFDEVPTSNGQASAANQCLFSSYHTGRTRMY